MAPLGVDPVALDGAGAEAVTAADGLASVISRLPLGGGPSYIDVAQQHGASYFDIGDAWRSATPIERLAANQHVLDIAIAHVDTVTLSVPFRGIDPNSFTAAEIRYLESHGYHRAGDNTLIPPTKGADR